MKELGYEESQRIPCLFWNKLTQIEVIVHVDDLLCVGGETDLQNLYQDLRKRYEMKCNIIGPGPHQPKEGEYLGRRIRFEEEGISVSADPKHVDTLLNDYGMIDCRPCSTPLRHGKVDLRGAQQGGQGGNAREGRQGT